MPVVRLRSPQVVRRFDGSTVRPGSPQARLIAGQAHRSRFDKAHRRLGLSRAGNPLRLQIRRVMRGSPQVFVRSRLRRASLLQPAIKAMARKILAAAGEPGAELSMDLVGDHRMRRLNREYRGRDVPTDVLAFPSAPFPLPGVPIAPPIAMGQRGKRTKVRGAANPLQRGNPPALLGDVVISLHTAARHAVADRRAVDHELTKLLIHGILHLVGYDHERGEREARRMRRKERAIWQALEPLPKLLGKAKRDA